MEQIKHRLVGLLRWSEKYTKTDMVYLARGGGWLGLGQAMSSLTGLILAVLFANFVSKEAYGLYKFVLSAAALLSIPTLTGMGIAVTRAVARGFEGTLSQALRSKMVWGMLGSIGGLVLAGYYYSQGNALLAAAFFVVALFLPVMEAFGLYDSFLQGKKEFGLSVKYATASKITSVIALAVTIIFTDNLILLLFAYFIPFTLSRFLFFRHVEKKLRINEVTDTDTVVYGKHLSVMGILSTIAAQVDRLLVFGLLGAVDLAAYAIAAAPVDQIKSLATNVSNIALPKFSQQTTENIRHTIWRRMAVLFLGLGATALLYWFAAPLIFKIFFPQYVDYIYLSQILGLSILSFGIFVPLQVLQGQQETARLYQLNTTASVVQILLSVGLVVPFGLPGIVFARVLTRLFNVSLFLFAMRISLQRQSS